MDYINYIDIFDQWDIEEDNQRKPKLYKQRANPFLLNDMDFKLTYGFTKNYVRKIVNLIKDHIFQDRRGGGISAELQVLTALRIWGRQEIQDDTADLHGLSQKSITHILRRVASALASKASLFVFMPINLENQSAVATGFRTICGFRNTVGAVGCTYLKIKKVGGQLGLHYIDRNIYSVNVQIVCDASLKIRDIEVGWRGSTHDSQIFRESQIQERFEAGEFVGHLIGDSGYTLTPYLFTPVINPRSPQEEAYNTAHILTRNTIGRCFSLWKQRFRCLLSEFTMSLENLKLHIVALAILHNIAIDMGEEVVEVPNLSDGNGRNVVPPMQQQENREGQVARSLFIQMCF